MEGGMARYGKICRPCPCHLVEIFVREGKEAEEPAVSDLASCFGITLLTQFYSSYNKDSY